MSVKTLRKIARIIGRAAPTAALLALASPVVAGAGCGGEYVVRAGDTLSRIAARCGSGSIDAWLAANPQIADPARISVGWRLSVPAAGDGQGMTTSDEVAPVATEVDGALTVSGWIVNGRRCALIATRDGEEYGVVSPDLSFRSGSEVTVQGRMVDDPSCKGPRTLLVTEQSIARL